MAADGATTDDDFAATAIAERTHSARAWSLRILRVLAGRANADLLAKLLEETGHRIAYADVLPCADWLAERAFIQTATFEDLPIYTLTRLGDDAGRGLIADAGMAPIRVFDAEADDRRRAVLSRRP